MGLDLLLILPILVLSVLGFKDGIVRKLIGVIMTLVGMVVAQIFMGEMGQFLVEEFDVDSGSAPVYGFISVFFLVLFLQSLLYRLLARGYKIGGIADRSMGSILGFIQGILIVSVVLVMFALLGIPSSEARKESRLYKPLVNIAPQILDAATHLAPDATDYIQEMTKPPEVKVPPREKKKDSGK